MTALFSSTSWPAWVLFGIPLLGILLGLIAGWTIQRWLRPPRATPTPDPETTAAGEGGGVKDDDRDDTGPLRDPASPPAARSSIPSTTRATPTVELHDERPRDALAALLVGDPSTVEGASGERRATGQPGWPNLGGVGRPTVPPAPNEPATDVSGATSSTATSPTARTPDAFSSHPEDRNIHRKRWLERNAEIIRRLDEANQKNNARPATLNAIKTERGDSGTGFDKCSSQTPKEAPTTGQASHDPGGD